MARTKTADYDEALAGLKRRISGRVCGLYVLGGEEPYLLDYYTRELRSFAEDEGDRTVLTREEFSARALADAVYAFPSMSSCRYAEVEYVDFSKLPRGETEAAARLLSELPEGVCAVLRGCVFGTGRNDPLRAASSEHGFAVDFPRQTPARLNKWLVRVFAASGIAAGADTAAYLISRAGSGMYGLLGEANKLCAYVKFHGRDTVTRPDVDFVTVKSSGIEDFALSNALLDGDYAKAASTVRAMLADGAEPVAVAASAARVYADMRLIHAAKTHISPDENVIAKALNINAYRVKLYAAAARRLRDPAAFLGDAVLGCAKCDLALKSAPVPGDFLLFDMLYRIKARGQ